MRTTTNLGLTVWDSNNDTFNSSQLAANWDAIDADYTRTRPANKVQTVATLASVPSPAEGTLAYLTAADSGFGAGTLMRYHSSVWMPVPGVEILSAVPGSGNFAGRTVLLSASSSGFAQWSLINYTGSAWQLLNHTYEILATVPSSGNFAGRLVMLTTANGGYNAYDLIRYDGSNWAKVGPEAIPPGTELLVYDITADIVTTNDVAPGDVLDSFSPATFENVKYYLEVSLPWVTHTVSQGSGNISLLESSTVIASLDIPTADTASAPTNYMARQAFIPSAGSHTYSLFWYTYTAGTLSVEGASHTAARVRVVKA